MISIQKFFGKDQTFFELLEASAEQGRNSIQALNRLLARRGADASMDEFTKPKQEDERITQRINEGLVKSFATQLEREDIELLNAALAKIPKTVEKFAEFFQISPPSVRETDFSEYIRLLDAATNQVVSLVKLLRTLGSAKIIQAKDQNAELQQIEAMADRLNLERLRELYSGEHDVVTVVMLRDLYELLEKVIDRCRDAGNVVTHIVLKHS